MSRHDLFYKWLFYAAASLLFIALQSLVFNRILVQQTHPFVFPILVAAAASLEPPREGFIFALVLGVLCDLTIPGVWPCLYTVTFALAALLCILIAEKLIVPGFWCCIVCGAVSIALCDTFNVVILHYRCGAAYPDALTRAGLELMLSILLAPFVYLLFRRINLRTVQD
ncbi:MAG: hypothetical protein KBS74_03600 [Clostridiales bacterium]|nr:hypothetical protein [Candidatus Cacconaster stercorequi]